MGKAFIDTADKVDSELKKGGGPYFLGEARNTQRTYGCVFKATIGHVPGYAGAVLY